MHIVQQNYWYISNNTVNAIYSQNYKLLSTKLCSVHCHLQPWALTGPTSVTYYCHVVDSQKKQGQITDHFLSKKGLVLKLFWPFGKPTYKQYMTKKKKKKVTYLPFKTTAARTPKFPLVAPAGLWMIRYHCGQWLII